MKIVLILMAMCYALESGGQPSNEMANRYLRAGIDKYAGRDYAGALIDFEKAIEVASRNYKAYRWEGRSLEKLGRFNEAIKAYSKALELNNGDTLSYKGRAEANRLLHQFAASLPDYDKAFLLNPRDLGVLYGRATSLYELNRFGESVRDYSSFIRINQKNSLVYFMRAGAYMADRQYKEAKDDISRYFKMGGNDDAAYYYRGAANVFLGGNNLPMIDSAIVDLTKYTSSNDELNRRDFKGFQLLGVAYAKRNDSVRSRVNFKAAVDLNPNIANTYARWGSSEIGFGNFRRANELLDEAYQMIDAPDDQYVDFLYNFALAKVGVRDTSAAIDLFERCIGVDSNKRTFYESRVQFLASSLKYNKIVLRDLNSMIRLSLDDREKAEWYSLKSLICLRTRQFSAARAEADTAVNMMPEEPLHYIIRAAINTMVNEPESIILKDINKAISLHGSLPEAYLLKASFYAARGNHKEGCTALKRAQEVGSKISEDLQAYVCKGKLPSNGKPPDIFVPLWPRWESLLRDR